MFSRIGSGLLAVLLTGCIAVPVAHAETEFGSEGYPATIGIEQTSTAQLFTKAGTVKCKVAKVSGTLSEPSPELTVTPTFSECTLAGIAATAEAKGTLVLSAGLQIKSSLIFKAKECTVIVTEQTLSKGLTYTEPESGFNISTALTGIAYTTTSGCSGGAGSFSDGEYSGTAHAAGNQGETWRAATKLCTQVPKAGVCPASSEFVDKAVFAVQSAAVKWETGLNTVTCANSNFAGEFDGDGRPATGKGGGITSWEFNSGGDCTSNFGGTPKVTITVESLPYELSQVNFAPIATRDGTLTFKKKTGAPQVKFVIHLGTGDISCFYEPASRLLADWSNVGASTLSFSNQAFKRIDATSNANCPTTFSLEAGYTISRKTGDGKIYVGNKIAP
jgi:hypothetical protein